MPEETQSSPQADSQVTSNSFNIKKVIITVEIITIVLGVLGLGFWYFLNQTINNQNTNTETRKSATTSASKSVNTNASQNSPIVTLNKFLSMVKAKDVHARDFIAQNCNREVFKAVIDTNYQGPSIYKKDFTFKIGDPKYDENGVTAQLPTEFFVKGDSLSVNYFLGKENGKWVLFDSWVSTPLEQIGPNFIDIVSNDKSDLKRSVIQVVGPVEVSLYSPNFGSIGFGINTTPKELGGIYGANNGTSTISMTDLYGVWVMKVIGSKDSDFTINTQVVVPEWNQNGSFKYEIKKGEIKYFSVVYPSEKNKPISVLPLM